jgi:tetratricopeptide (TPR) repeat protein
MMIRARRRCKIVPVVSLTMLLLVAMAAPAVRARSQNVPPEALQALDKIYSGEPHEGLRMARDMERANPDSPLGYLLEGEARWSLIYCAACEMKWGMVDAWKRSKSTQVWADGENHDDAYMAATDKAIELALAGIARTNNATDHLYAGMGYALKARLLGLRDESRAVAKVAVAARQEFLDALALDPQTADATAGLGLYNYYVDSLSGIVKVLRFFMGIPGGSKQDGIRQLEEGANNGVLMKVIARFYLAKNLRSFDLDYARAAATMKSLVEEYPRNPAFLLMMGNLELEQGHTAEAEKTLRSVGDLEIRDEECRERARRVAGEMLATIH